MKNSALTDLLNTYRDTAPTPRDKGTRFEKLTLAYLQHDPIQSQYYANVRPWKEWAVEHGWDQSDDGIDLVAELKDEEGYAAIQCKFFSAEHSIRRYHIDSFISFSGKNPFKRRVIVDTSEVSWSKKAREVIEGQSIPTIRIGLQNLDESPIDWEVFLSKGEIAFSDKKKLRPHQREAFNAVCLGLQDKDRGKLIMACGTGKTLVSLRIAEEMAGVGGRVLFLMPSLSLMAQAVREWTYDAKVGLRSFAVCSDTQVGYNKSKRSRLRKGGKDGEDDSPEIDVLDLEFPATTDSEKLARGVRRPVADKMTVVFATYQSIDVIAAAQSAHGVGEFDLIICDEAHRTTGFTEYNKKEESDFVKVHENAVIQGKKRLYMTATPRIYAENIKKKARIVKAIPVSMDDEDLFGEDLFYYGFAEAVDSGLLTDYKVVVLMMDEKLVSASVQRRLASEDNELQLDDATKIIGCYKILTKENLKKDLKSDPFPMRRALGFCGNIEKSKLIEKEFTEVVKEFLAAGEKAAAADEAAAADVDEAKADGRLKCEVKHVDGTFDAKERFRQLNWLSGEAENECRILTNARCLSEGVDHSES